MCSVEGAELLAGKDVEVDMVYGLTGERADIRHDAITIGKAHFLRKLCNDGVNVTDQRLIFLRHLRGGGEMRLRDDEEMYGSHRRDVLAG